MNYVALYFEPALLEPGILVPTLTVLMWAERRGRR